MNSVVRSDIVVKDFLDSMSLSHFLAGDLSWFYASGVGGYRHRDRRDRLLDILDIDLDW
jgi:CCR4-NOT complex subunit CAF16